MIFANRDFKTALSCLSSSSSSETAVVKSDEYFSKSLFTFSLLAIVETALIRWLELSQLTKFLNS